MGSVEISEKRPLFSLYSEELNGTARELRGELYCLPCHDKMGIPICQACHRPIEERIVTALGKHWHVEVCSVEGTLLRLMLINIGLFAYDF